MLYDAVIIGGGPAGSRVAARLAGIGHRTAVLEQKDSPGGAVCCTGIIGMECVHRFEVDESVITRYAASAKIYSPGGEMIHLQRPEPQAAMVHRPSFNRLFAERAAAGGAELLFGRKVISLKSFADKVEAVFQNGSGQTGSINARVAVMATGYSPSIPGEAGPGVVKDHATGVQAEVETQADYDEIEVYLGNETAPGFFAWLVPQAPGRALAGLLSRRHAALHLKNLLDSLAAQGKIKSAETPAGYAGAAMGPGRRSYGERVISVGSAAGQVKPLTGGGIFYSLLCADIAADNLHRALESDNLSAVSLARYETQWKHLLGRDIRIGLWGRRLFRHLGDSQIDQLFRIARSSGVAEALMQADDLAFDWHGAAVLRILGNRMVSKALGSVKLPVSLRKEGGKEKNGR